MRKLLTNGMWSKLEPLFPAEKGRKSRPSKDNRLMFEGMLWKLRTGCPWRDLPDELGPWNSVYTRFNRWCQSGVFLKALTSLQEDVDWEWLMLDSSIVRAHQHAHGAKKKREPNTSGSPLVVRLRKST
jgi:putative transposase